MPPTYNEMFCPQEVRGSSFYRLKTFAPAVISYRIAVFLVCTAPRALSTFFFFFLLFVPSKLSMLHTDAKH